jgi:hypothetical protein
MALLSIPYLDAWELEGSVSFPSVPDELKQAQAEPEVLESKGTTGASTPSKNPVVTSQTSVPHEEEVKVSESENLGMSSSEINDKKKAQMKERVRAKVDGKMDPELAEKLEKRRELEGYK